MAHYMPPPMLAMFAPRPPLEFVESAVPKRSRPVTGLAAYLGRFKEPGQLAPLVKHETAPEKRQRRSKKRAAKAAHRILVQSKQWNPHQNESPTEDAYKTLFVSRLDHSITEEELKKEMMQSGPVKSIRIVKDRKTDKPRGYAFVEFQDEKDLKHAYKAHDGKKIKDRRICVDVERGRTVPNWKPRRLGGGLGSTRKGDKKKKGAGAAAPIRRDDIRPERPREGMRKEPRPDYRDRDRDRYRDERSRDDRSRDARPRDRDRDRRGRDREPPRDREPGRDRDPGRDREPGRDRDPGRDREREPPRDREPPRYRERDRDYDRSSRSHRDSGSRSSHRDRDESRRDDRRLSSGMLVNGPPLPPQSVLF